MNHSDVSLLIRLHGNPLGDEGIGYIADALADDDKVTTLDVGDCQIGDEGIEKLSEMLAKNKTLQDLNLSGNSITNKGWEKFSDALKSNSTLTTLSLDFNNLQDEGVEILSEGLIVVCKSFTFDSLLIADSMFMSSFVLPPPGLKP